MGEIWVRADALSANVRRRAEVCEQVAKAVGTNLAERLRQEGAAAELRLLAEWLDGGVLSSPQPPEVI